MWMAKCNQLTPLPFKGLIVWVPVVPVLCKVVQLLWARCALVYGVINSLCLAGLLCCFCPLNQKL